MAIEWASKLPEDEQARAMVSVANEWAKSDPIGLATYLQQGELDIRYNYARIAEGIADRDDEAAAAWVEGLESEDHRSYGIMGLAQRAMHTSPANAFEMLERIGNTLPRNMQHAYGRSCEKVFEQWAYFDPASARSALEKSSLSQKQKSRILKAVANLKVAP